MNVVDLLRVDMNFYFVVIVTRRVVAVNVTGELVGLFENILFDVLALFCFSLSFFLLVLIMNL